MAVFACALVGRPVDNPRTRGEFDFNDWDYAEWCQFRPSSGKSLHLNPIFGFWSLIRGHKYRWDIQALRCNRRKTEIESLHNLCGDQLETSCPHTLFTRMKYIVSTLWNTLLTLLTCPIIMMYSANQKWSKTEKVSVGSPVFEWMLCWGQLPGY